MREKGELVGGPLGSSPLGWGFLVLNNRGGGVVIVPDPVNGKTG